MPEKIIGIRNLLIENNKKLLHFSIYSSNKCKIGFAQQNNETNSGETKCTHE